MGTKYHISDSGNVAICEAKKEECPKENFETFEEAERSLERESGGSFPANNRQKRSAALRDAEKYYGGKYVTEYELGLPEGVEGVLDDLRTVGNPLIVGGAVRDSFIGADNKDIDIEVHGTTIDNLVKTLKKKKYTVDEVGKEFGVLKVSKPNGVTDLDISVPRKENRLGAGHRSFDVEMDENMSVSEAAERRDFTFNAVMYDHERKVLVDPANGREDFKNNVMKHVSEKFREDPLRVLRGFQFAGRFGMKMHPETTKMCKELRHEYGHLSTERVQEEWGKFFSKSTKPLNAVKTLQNVEWDDTSPGLRESLKSTKTKKALSNLPYADKDRKVIYGSAAIVQEMSESDRKKFLAISVIGVKEQKQAHTLATFDKSKASTTYDRKKLAEKLNRDGFNFDDYGKFSEMNNDADGVKVAALAKSEGIGSKPEPHLVMGKDVLEFTDQKPGPWMGKALAEISDRQYRGEFKSKDEAIVALKKLI